MLDASFPQSGEYPLVYRNLMAISLLGCVHDATEDAEKVGKAVERTLTQPAQFRVYKAMALSIGGKGEAAIEAMTRQLEQDPDDDSAKLALAVARMTSGDEGCKALLESVLATTADPGAREAANSLLDYMKTHS